MPASFDRLRLVAPADAEDALAAELWSAGTLGLEIRADGRARVVVEAWFDADGVPPNLVERLRDAGADVAHDAVAAVDHLARYRATAEPFAIGERFWVDPRDPSSSDSSAPVADRFELRLPARVAFGTGSHETTRLMLELLERVELAGRTVLDVGTGSGVLSFAALRLGARAAVGFDVDAPSALVAAQNAALNPWPTAPRFYAGRLDALRADTRFDVALVNVLPERIRGDLARIAAAIEPDGTLLNAGALAADRAAVEASWRAVGLAAFEARTMGEWLALALRPEAGP